MWLENGEETPAPPTTASVQRSRTGSMLRTEHEDFPENGSTDARSLPDVTAIAWKAKLGKF